MARAADLIYQNSRDVQGYDKSDRRCCTVLAMCNAFNMTFDEAQQYLANHGRRKGRGFQFRQFLGRFAPEGNPFFGHNVVPIAVPKKGDWSTLTRFVVDHPKGKYFVFTKGHVLVVNNGVIVDHEQRPRRHVEQAFQLIETGAK